MLLARRLTCRKENGYGRDGDVNAMYDLIKLATKSRRSSSFSTSLKPTKQRGTALDDYRSAFGEVKNPVNRFLLQLIVSDEEKHRAVIHAMVATLKGSLTWTKPAGSLEGIAGRRGRPTETAGRHGRVHSA